MMFQFELQQVSWIKKVTLQQARLFFTAISYFLYFNSCWNTVSRYFFRCFLFIFLGLFSSHGDSYAVDFETPITYTAALMAVEFAALHALDLEEDDIQCSNFEDVLRHPRPVHDNDSYLVNFFLHPLMGSETYLRARESDFGVEGSVAFSMGASITWEYLIESWTEQPSIEDLVLTTGIGWMIGELRYQIKHKGIQKKKRYFWVDPIWYTLEYLDFSITNNNGKYNTLLSIKVPM